MNATTTMSKEALRKQLGRLFDRALSEGTAPLESALAVGEAARLVEAAGYTRCERCGHHHTGVCPQA